jgi:hypothetical protein
MDTRNAQDDQIASPAGRAAVPPQPVDRGENSADTLDFSHDQPGDAKVAKPQIAGKYDPRPQEDSARRNIAYLLIGLLWLVVAAVFILIAFGSINVTDLKELGVILGPLVALVSAATGFYYGTKSTEPPRNP